MNDKRLGGYAFASVVIMAVLYAFGPKNLLVFNATNSVPVGIYMKASPENARYVTALLHEPFLTNCCIFVNVGFREK